jgi:hypothetical protein
MFRGLLERQQNFGCIKSCPCYHVLRRGSRSKQRHKRALDVDLRSVRKCRYHLEVTLWRFIFKSYSEIPIRPN